MGQKVYSFRFFSTFVGLKRILKIIHDMYRTHTCGELRISNVGQKVTLAGWVQKSRKLGGMTFIDLRDRYGITQLVVDDAALVETAAALGREFVIQVTGEVVAAG